MRLFGWDFTANKQPRWASFQDVLALSGYVQDLANKVEAMRKKVYRDGKADEATADNLPEGVKEALAIEPTQAPQAQSLNIFRTGDTPSSQFGG